MYPVNFAYFSRAGENYNVGVVGKGNTATVAEMIADKTGGGLFEIRPTTSYPFDYGEMLAVARLESSQNAHPEMAESVSNMADYEVIFLDYLIWNGDMPMIVYNFLETYVCLARMFSRSPPTRDEASLACIKMRHKATSACL